MKAFETPEFMVIRFEAKDVIVTSGCEPCDECTPGSFNCRSLDFENP